MKQYRYNNFSFNTGSNYKIFYPKDIEEIKSISKKKFTIVGNNRSYNDSAIGPNPISLKKNFNKVISFNIKKKEIEVEGGMLLKDFFEVVIKKGLILKSVPGSRYVTIGGMVANNTQGKKFVNPFFGSSIISLKILNNGKIIYCSKKKKLPLFIATIGGKGTTGIILSIKIKLEKLKSSKILVEKIFFKNIKEMILITKNINKVDYIVAWIDYFSNLNSGILFYAKHLKTKFLLNKRAEIKIPNYIVYLLNYISSKKFFSFIFNKIFKFNNFLRKKLIYNIHDFLFIQDTLVNWNCIFKKKGFLQFQLQCELKELEEILNYLKKNFLKKNIFSNFVVIKFILIKKKIECTLSLDIPLDNNFTYISSTLRKFVFLKDINVSLSKDLIMKKINKTTLINNNFLKDKYLKFRDYNFNSKFINRIKI